MNFWPRVTGRSLEYKLNRTGARTEPLEGRYVGVSKNWCHCPRAPWNVDLEAAYPPVGWTNMACFNSVCKEDQYARQCHMLLLIPERRRQSLGSAGINFWWKWWGQQPGHKCFNLSGNQPGLDWVNLRLWENALECKTLHELVTHSQQWDWAVVSCQTQIFTRFFNGNYLGLSPDLRGGMCSHDSGEEFGQPGVSCGTQVHQGFHVDVVVTWDCRWFPLLHSSLFSEWMKKTLVWHLLQKSSALQTNLAFKLLVVRCFRNQTTHS